MWKWNCFLHMINTTKRVQNAKQVWVDLKWRQMQDVSSTHTQPLPLIAQNPAKCMQPTYITHFHQSCTYFSIRFSIPYDTTPGGKRCLFVFYFVLFGKLFYVMTFCFVTVLHRPEVGQLNKDRLKTWMVRSRKIGFCVAPYLPYFSYCSIASSGLCCETEQARGDIVQMCV